MTTYLRDTDRQAERDRLHDRLVWLRAAKKDLEEQIALVLDELEDTKRGRKPSCGTEKGYQWHRYHDRDNWPLPAGDPCGCKAAHRAHARAVTRASAEARWNDESEVA